MKHQIMYPIGRKIVNIREMTPTEIEKEGWGFYRYINTAVMELDDGNIIYASADPEGNGPGCLFGYLISEDTGIYIEPLKEQK